ncbi:MAG: HAMP domain-containing histidine kinase [Gemmatimonadetes bacterium]|nr:HAMP domain-containing histidine kinase [Gemmatimonadota bacterium]NNM04396.1 HAMP domain-containing histidine kinase [Gemmatimonadota bacterium]
MTRTLQARSFSRVISQAAEVVLSTWPEDSGYRSREEVGNCLATILEAAEDGERQEWKQQTTESIRKDRPLVRRLLEPLRLHVLLSSESPSDGLQAQDFLDALTHLETVRQASLPREAREFSSRLTDPDGFELLVEVAHDLRSPLTSITFMAETLRAGYSGDLTDMQKDQMSLIWSAAFGMMSVFSDLMDLAKERANMFEDSPGPFSISGVFEELRQMVQPMVVVKGIELRMTPPLHESVIGHRSALFRILLNLTTNAIKFTEEGFVEVSARTLDRDRVEFSVRDTGRAIAPEAQETLFEPFKKARDRRGYFFSGSGLGLSIARRYLRGLDSELFFETKPGWGTRFHFELLLKPSQGF